MLEYPPVDPPPERHRFWDEERRLSFGAWHYRNASIFRIYERFEPVAGFDGNNWKSRALTPAEQAANPGCYSQMVWSLHTDWGTGRYADLPLRRALIRDFLDWYTVYRDNQPGYENNPNIKRSLPTAEVHFDIPFEGT